MGIVTLKKAIAENPYTEAIEELIKATAEHEAAIEAGDAEPDTKVAYELELTPKVSENGKVRGILGERAKFQAAARAAGYTATVSNGADGVTDPDTGVVTLAFTLGAKHKSGPRNAGDEVAPAEDSAKVEPEATAKK